LTSRAFALYEPARGHSRHLAPRPGDRLPLLGIEATVVSSGGVLLGAPLAGGGQTNAACPGPAHYSDDGTENFRSLGVLLRYGAFSFVDLGDLSGETLIDLVCPTNLIGQVSAYLIAHHGDWDSNAPAVYAALKPQAAIMNNGATKGGDPAAIATVRALPATELWQLHASRHPSAQNSPAEFVANLDDQECGGYWIKLVANEDGRFTVTNGRTGFVRTYPRTAERRGR
jgi:hypothetical protein